MCDSSEGPNGQNGPPGPPPKAARTLTYGEWPTEADLDRIDDWLCQQVKQWMQAKGVGAEAMWKRLAEAADAIRALRARAAMVKP